MKLPYFSPGEKGIAQWAFKKGDEGDRGFCKTEMLPELLLSTRKLLLSTRKLLLSTRKLLLGTRKLLLGT